MGVRRTLSVVTAFGGVVAAWLGMRVFDASGWVGVTLLAAAVLGLVGTTVWQAFTAVRTEGETRPVEAVFALSFAALAVGTVGMILGSQAGIEWLGLEFESPRGRVRFARGVLVAAAAVLAGGATTGLAAYWAARRGGRRPPTPVDVRRIRETAAHALSLAAAGVALMLLGYVAAARNQTLDASYFKTSRPGDAVQSIVRNLDAPLRVALFFPEVNAVKDEVRTYMEGLAQATDNVAIEEYDRFADPEMAQQMNVRADGDVVLRVGDRTERIGLPPDLDGARGRLRVLDGQVQQALLRLARERRVAYMTIGHGELNDPLQSAMGDPPTARLDGGFTALNRMLELLNYESRELGLQEGLGDRIPDDAAMLMVLGPERPFLESESSAVRDYLNGGGSLLLALEADSEFRLDDLRDPLGLEVQEGMTVDEDRHLRQTGGVADRRLIVTNRFSPHPSVATASRQGPGSGVLLIGPLQLTAPEETEDRSVSLTVRTMSSSFVDSNGNYRYDEESESRGEGAVAAAVSRDGEGGGMRALVFGDAELFTDPVLTSLGLNAALAADAIRWLGGEEDTAGEVVSEEDVPIVHTQQEDVAWFYAIIFGAPALVLMIGALVLYRRRTWRPRS